MINLCILFGGSSNEYEVSCETTKHIIDSFPEGEYNIYLLGLTQNNEWYLYNGLLKDFSPQSWIKTAENAFISPDSRHHGIITGKKIIYIDVVYIAMHGACGEDGAAAGLLELAKIPFVGSSILGSAICYDKKYFKKYLTSMGLPQANWLVISQDDKLEEKILSAETNFNYPLFVKPSKGGSSIGVSKCYNKDEFYCAIEKALFFDDYTIVEEYVEAFEIECPIICNKFQENIYLPLLMVVPNNEFYDYHAKYTAGLSEYHIPAPISAEEERIIKCYNSSLIKEFSMTGICRIDYFILKKDRRILVNEINTQPGIASDSNEKNIWKKDDSIFQSIDLAIKVAMK